MFAPFFMNPLGGGGFIIQGSGLFDGSSGQLAYNPGTPTDNLKWTYSWVGKLCDLAGTDPAGLNSLLDASTGDNDQVLFRTEANTLRFYQYDGGFEVDVKTNQVFRDPAAYYHIVLNYDSANATAGERLRIYVNGARVTDFGTADYPSLNLASDLNKSGAVMGIGRRQYGTSGQISYFEGYLANVAFIDGQSLDPTSFGELTDSGFWQINDASDLTFGNNGFLIVGGTAIAAGTDSSGNSNNFGKSGTITATSDSPTNGGDDNEYGNLVTINPLEPKAGGFTLSNGNKTYVSTGAQANMLATFGATSGKFYWEVNITTLGAGTSQFSYGIAAETWDPSTTSFGPADTWYLNSNGSNSNYANSGTSVSGIAVAAAGDVMQIALDLDNQKLWFGNDDTWYTGEPDNGSTPAYTNLIAGERYIPIFGGHSAGTHMQATIVLDEDDWTYTVPTGFTSLSTANLSTPAIINPEEHFFSTIIDHDGSDTDGTCTFNLDTYEWLAIIKNTTGAAENWYMIDSLRGVTKIVTMNTNDAETTDANVLTVSGTTFTLGSTLGAKNYLVEFHKAGLASATASNTEGSLNTTATSVNLVSGFAISTYTGTGSNTNYGHGLNSAPEWTITKLRVGSTQGNYAWHVGLGAGTKVIYPHLTNAIDTAATVWNSTVPSATLNSLGTSVGVNTNTYTYVNWSWHSVDGFSKFGSYEGNGNADGAFVNTGFAQESMFVKNIDAVENWVAKLQVLDNTNENISRIFFEQTAAADTSTSSANMDMVSNGFKNRGTNAQSNSAATFIYGAWGGRAMTDGAINQGRAK